MDTVAIPDLVIVLPGIMGSELRNADGRVLWSTSAGGVVGAISTLGKSITSLQLPEGLGDEDPRDGVRATAVLPDLVAIPGLWRPITGYRGLLRYLSGPDVGLHIDEGVRGPTPNLIAFPYDWRLSNRLNGRRLAAVAFDALERWRADSMNPDAQLILVGHSMGGLVARWFLEQEGGADVTRMLITLGTPFRGAASALDTLSNGMRPGMFKLRFDLTPLVQSFPSMYQLLPTYDCLETVEGRVSLTSAGAPHLDSARVADAVAFHGAMSQVGPYVHQKVIGVQQPTATTGVVVDGGVRVLTSIDGRHEGGDGTVPNISAQLVDGWGANVMSVAEQHGEIQQAPNSYLQLYNLITDSTKTMQGVESSTDVFGVQAPDVVVEGESLVVQVSDANDRVFRAQLELDGQQMGSPVYSDHADVLRLTAPAAGGYRLHVTPDDAAQTVTVTSPILVLPRGGVG